MSESDVSLELATLDEIVDELEKRTLSGVLITLSKDKSKSDWEVPDPRYWGGFIAAIGLVNFAKRVFENEAKLEREHGCDDEN